MEGSPEGMKVPPMAEKEPLQGVAQVLHQMKAVDDLDRLWGAVPDPFSIEPTPITADDLDARVRLQPVRDRGGRALREQIDHSMPFEITNHGAEASASPPRPFLQPYHSGSRKRRGGRTMNETQNRPATPREAQHLRESRTGAAANGEAHVA